MNFIRSKYSNYRYCIVKECKNTSINNPDKLWIRLPSETNRRNTWLRLAGRDPDKLSTQSVTHLCEDHFDIEKDTVNYMQYKIMALENGQKVKLHLKKGVVPHIFHCQDKATLPPPPEVKTRKREALIKEALQLLAEADLTEADLPELEKDMENYMQYKLMGSVKRIQMKQDCVPSKFECQPSSRSDGPSSSKQARPSSRGEEEISTLSGQDALCDTSGVKVKLEPEDGCTIEDQSDQNGDYGLHEEVDIKEQIEPMDDDEDMADIKLEPHVKLEPEEHGPGDIDTSECMIFEPCTRKMLPRVDMFAIIQYFIQNGGIYEQLDFNKLKEDNDDIYADDTIGHVQINKNTPSTTLQCTVAFNRTTSHTCLVKYSVYTRSVEWARCECGERACGHVVAFLMWIHRRAEERIDNDMSFALEPMTQETTFIRAKDLALDNDTDTASDSLGCPDSAPLSGDIVQEFVMKCVQNEQFNSPLYKYLCSDPFKDLAMHRMACKFIKEGASDGAEPELFLSYCTQRVQERASTLDRLETDVGSDVRQELEYGRIDAEHFLMAAEGDQEIIDELMFPDLYIEDKMVEEMRLILEKKLATRIIRTGIFINRYNPIFCAAPYGIADTCVIDITYVREGQKLEDFVINGVLTDHVKAKLQLFMKLTKRNNSKLFLGYKDENNKKQIQIHEYPYNERYCNELLENASQFWKKNVYMKLLL